MIEGNAEIHRILLIMYKPRTPLPKVTKEHAGLISNLLFLVGSQVIAVRWERSSAKSTIERDIAVHSLVLVALVGRRNTVKGSRVGGTIYPLPIISACHSRG
jgi:hypothetical protein